MQLANDKNVELEQGKKKKVKMVLIKKNRGSILPPGTPVHFCVCHKGTQGIFIKIKNGCTTVAVENGGGKIHEVITRKKVSKINNGIPISQKLQDYWKTHPKNPAAQIQ